MTTLNKINVKGKEYSLDGVKVAEIKCEYGADELIFQKNDIYIDFDKNIRIEVYLNNEQLMFGYVIFFDKAEGILKTCFIEDGTIENIGDTAIYGYSFIFYYENYEKISDFFISISKNAFEYESSDNVTAKVYYVEANELTIPYHYEV